MPIISRKAIATINASPHACPAWGPPQGVETDSPTRPPSRYCGRVKTVRPCRCCGPMPEPQVIVVVGASQGGVATLQRLVAGLPPDFAAAVFVVLHTGAHKSELPHLLNHAGPLPAAHPRTGDPIQSGHIYVAPPDYHLIVERGHVQLMKGPKENWARPAIDPLFRSAARAYGRNVIGVILTGALNDGTAGLFEVKERGGTTVVQDPDDAENPSMPRSALAHVRVDHCVPLSRLPQLLVRLVHGKADALAADRGARELARE